MNPDSENFDSLRRLLSLKRHEQPPPGYFNRFSSDVMARIKAGERGGETSLEPSWWQRLTGMFEIKPVFAGAFGVAVCALLISGVISSEHLAASNSAALAASGGSSFNPNATPGPDSYAVNTAFEASSTNPAAPQTESLFDRFQVQPQEASLQYQISRGN